LQKCKIINPRLLIKAAFAMTAHWRIENNLHWVFDAILHEDYCLVWKDNAAANLHVVRKIVLNILKAR